MRLSISTMAASSPESNIGMLGFADRNGNLVESSRNVISEQALIDYLQQSRG